MKTWTPEMIKERLLRGDSAKFVEKALKALAERQTADEQVGNKSLHQNGRGFNKFDAQPLMNIVKKTHMNDADIRYARRKLVKYCKQLAEIANENERRKETR